MKYYYRKNTPFITVYEKDEPLEVLPRFWEEITEEEYREILNQDWEIPNAD